MGRGPKAQHKCNPKAETGPTVYAGSNNHKIRTHQAIVRATSSEFSRQDLRVMDTGETFHRYYLIGTLCCQAKPDYLNRGKKGTDLANLVRINIGEPEE